MPHVQTSLYVLLVAMAWSFSDDSTISYVLLILWMTSCFHIVVQIQIQAMGKLFTVTYQMVPLGVCVVAKYFNLPGGAGAKVLLSIGLLIEGKE